MATHMPRNAASLKNAVFAIDFSSSLLLKSAKIDLKSGNSLKSFLAIKKRIFLRDVQGSDNEPHHQATCWCWESDTDTACRARTGTEGNQVNGLLQAL